MKNPKIKELNDKLKLATREVKDIERQMRAASFKSCSQFSQSLVKEDLAKATAKQMDVIMEIVEAGIPSNEAEALVKSATK